MTVQNALEEMKERAFAPAFQKYLFDTYKVLAQTDFSEEENYRFLPAHRGVGFLSKIQANEKWPSVCFVPEAIRFRTISVR